MVSFIAIFLLAFIIISFLSAAEMAFVSSNKLRIREMADAGDKNAKFISQLQERPNHFLSACLIGSNIANITAVSVWTYMFQKYFGWNNEYAAVAVLAPFLIVFGEMVPKDLGRIMAVVLLTKQTFWFRILKWFFYGPIIFFFKLLRVLGISFDKEKDGDIFVNEGEFRSLIEESAERGVVGEQEKRLIHTILDFERVHVSSVMIPVEQVPMVDISSKINDVFRIARQTQSKMMLIYEEIPSIVMGMIYVFDILWEEKTAQGLHDFLRAPIFMPLETSLEKAFLTLQKKRQSYAVVTDRFGDIQGVVPIERLLMFEKR